MTNEIIIRNNLLDELTRIQNVINPIISEQVNAHYTFSFDTVIDDKMAFLNDSNIIEVDNEYFRIARIVKSRNTSVSMTINCEHVTYDLLDKYHYPMPFEEFEGSPQQMMTTLLSGTPFKIGQITVDGDRYIKPNSDNIRGTLIEIANLFGGELLYDKSTISLVSRRGVVSNQEFRLGENLIGVTEEIDFTEGYPRKSLEVDVIDLSEVKGYEYLLTIGLGDTVTTIDPILKVNESLRIVNKEYNPFQKINPRVQIGHVIRDMTDYLKEEIVEETPTLDLQVFKIDNIDCLSLTGVDVTEKEKERMRNGTAYEPTAIVDTSTLNEHLGLFVERSSNQVGIRVREIVNGQVTEYFYKDIESLKTKKYPSTNDFIVQVIISTDNIDSLTADSNFRMFAVKFGKSTGGNPYLSEFRVGDVDCLALSDLELAYTATSDDITATIEYSNLNEFTGLFVSLREEYADWSIYAQSSSYGFLNLKNTDTSSYAFPSMQDEFLMVFITKDPIGEVDPPEDELKGFGVKFELVEKPFEIKPVMYAYIDSLYEGDSPTIRGITCYNLKFITNITNFRENFVDRNFIFETRETTNELYPCDFRVASEIRKGWLEQPTLVQVVDGVITSIISPYIAPT